MSITACATGSCMRKSITRYEKAKYLVRWSSLCLVEFGRALATGKLRKARAILLAVAHGCAGRFGNRNAAFL